MCFELTAGSGENRGSDIEVVAVEVPAAQHTRYEHVDHQVAIWWVVIAVSLCQLQKGAWTGPSCGQATAARARRTP
jgi:hypothetical protein